MNNYILQRLISRTPKCPFSNPWKYRNISVSACHFTKEPPSTQTLKPEAPQQDWVTIYKFPYILAASRVAKLRKLQYIVTCVAPPVTYAFEHYELVSEYSTLLALSMCVSLSATLTFCSFMFRRLVGFVYVDPARQNVKIGYLTFGGKREDKVIKLEDVKTFAETQKFKYQSFRTVATYTDNTKYKLIDLHGIVKRDDFELVFGSH